MQRPAALTVACSPVVIGDPARRCGGLRHQASRNGGLCGYPHELLLPLVVPFIIPAVASSSSSPSRPGLDHDRPRARQRHARFCPYVVISVAAVCRVLTPRRRWCAQPRYEPAAQLLRVTLPQIKAQRDRGRHLRRSSRRWTRPSSRCSFPAARSAAGPSGCSPRSATRSTRRCRHQHADDRGFVHAGAGGDQPVKEGRVSGNQAAEVRRRPELFAPAERVSSAA